jgi:hypothetical protein
MSGTYGAVARVDNQADDDVGRQISFIPSQVDAFLKGPSRTALAQRDTPTEEDQGDRDSTIHFRVNPESCRCIAYAFFFWFMCTFAILMTKFVVGPELANGPLDPADTCPPFSGNKSHGFDINTNSHLKDAFGFNNVRIMCVI